VSIYFSGKKMNHTPGQFVMLNYPTKDTFVKRAYSIASSPTKDYLQLCIKAMPKGFVSQEFQTVKVGTEFEMTGPHGRFVLDLKHNEIVLIGAGSGVAPYLSMLQFAQENELDNNVTLFTSHKTGRDCIYQKDFEQIAQKSRNIRLFSCVTREENTGVRARCGRITKEYMLEHLQSFVNKHFYLCGPSAFVLAMKDLLLKEGVTKDNITLEVYG
jgi:ferredoxin-NADP reductase